MKKKQVKISIELAKSIDRMLAEYQKLRAVNGTEKGIAGVREMLTGAIIQAENKPQFNSPNWI